MKTAETILDIYGIAGALQLVFKLTFKEARFVVWLLRLGYAPRGELRRIDPALANVIIASLRHKLRRHEIGFETDWGRGYRISDDGREKILASVGQKFAPTLAGDSTKTYSKNHEAAK
ncbi:MAG: hypothetical protein WD871_01710 [Xanthobacteraceae bacterium]